MPGNAPAAPQAGAQSGDKTAQKDAWKKGITDRVKAKGCFEHGDVQDLRQQLDEGETEQSLVDYLTTPEGQQAMSKAGKGGQDVRELARDVLRGR